MQVLALLRPVDRRHEQAFAGRPEIPPMHRAAVIEATAHPNRDLLTHHLARKHINRAQYDAGREFRRIFELADKRRDGANLADDQDAAWKALAKCYRQLGHDGSALVHDMLIDGMTAKQVAEARGNLGAGWPKYYARRYFMCLSTLAETFGFASIVRQR